MSTSPTTDCKKIADLTKRGRSRSLVAAPQDTLEELLATLAEHQGMGQVYVVDQEGRLCGSVSPLNLLQQRFPLVALAAESDCRGSTRRRSSGVAGDVMRLRPLYVTRSTSVVEAVRIMLREHVTELPVVDERMRFVGRLTAVQVLAALSEQKSAEAPDPSGPPLAEERFLA